MNKTVIIGRIVRDPEIKYLPGTGVATTTFVVAVDRMKKKDGTKEADFIPVVSWNKTAELVVQYTKKGSLIGISGRIQVRNYEAKDGTKRYVTEVIADEVQFLDKKETEHTENTNQTEHADMEPADEIEVPF